MHMEILKQKIEWLLELMNFNEDANNTCVQSFLYDVMGIYNDQLDALNLELVLMQDESRNRSYIFNERFSFMFDLDMYKSRLIKGIKPMKYALYSFTEQELIHHGFPLASFT